MRFDPVAAFNQAFDAAIAEDVAESGFQVPDWFWNGRTRPLDAVSQWRERGPVLVANFIRWFEESGEQVWITPDGRPAIELELRPKFGDIEVRMFIDLITQGPLGLTVIDVKSGYRKPDSLQQLGIYASGVELTYGKQWRPLWGAHFLARGTGPKDAKPEDKVYMQPRAALDEYRYSAEFFTRELAAFELAVQSGIFVARPSGDCDRCGVAYACLAVGGTDAPLFDPAHPDHAGNQEKEQAA